MNEEETSYRRWARRCWRPGRLINPTWNVWTQDEIQKIQQDRIVILEQETIRRIISYADQQWKALFDLYFDLYPMLPGKTGYIQIRPRCNSVTYDYISLQFIQFDQLHHPDCLPGGIWVQQGWDIDDTLQDWEVWVPAQPEPGEQIAESGGQ